MRQFSKEDRKEIEEIIITFVRDYDHQEIMKNLIPYKGRLFNVVKRLKFGLFSKTSLFS